MSESRNTVTRYLSFLAVPLWAGSWPSPLSGVAALQVVLFILASVALWVCWKADPVSRVFKRSYTRPQRLRAAANGLLSRTRSPLFLSVLVVLLFAIPFFQNDYYRDVLTLTGMYAVLALGSTSWWDRRGS